MAGAASLQKTAITLDNHRDNQNNSELGHHGRKHIPENTMDFH
jgi:hypothetical protein